MKPKPFLSPLRYPGSKRRLAGFIAQALSLNGLQPTLYVEVFAGGASVALHLMQNDLVDKVILIDVDPLVANFWKAVFFDTDWLIEQIQTIEVTIDRWREFKAFQPITQRDYALTCLFLNRTNFSGILRNEIGPLGGREQKSRYKIDCRFPRETLVDRVKRLADFRDKVLGVWDCSWKDGVERIRVQQKAGELPGENTFFYFDPPFFEKADSLYRFYFHEHDHVELRDFLLGLEASWILSYDSADQVEKLYGHAIKNGTNGAKKHDVELIYSTGIMLGRKPTKEVIISNLKELPSETRFWKMASGIDGGRRR